MPFLTCTINPAGVAQLHDILACLARFEENVILEAGSNYVRNILSRSEESADWLSYGFQA